MSALANLTDIAAALTPKHIERFPVTDRTAWLAMRSRDVTASVIAALIGEHPYTTAYELHYRKAGLHVDESVEPIVTGTSISLPPMMRGTELEAVAPRLIRMLRNQWIVEPCGFYFRDPVARIGATPDFFALDPSREGFGNIQVKTCDQMTFRGKWKADGGVEPPMFIVLQAIVEAALTGATWAEVAVLVTGFNLDLHLISIPLHVGVMDRLRSETAAFWRRIETGHAPDPDFARDGVVLSKIHREDDGGTIDLSGDNRIALLQSLDERLSKIGNRVEEKRKAIKAEVLSKMGAAAVATCHGAVIATAKTVHRKEYVAKASSYRDIRLKRIA